MANKPRYMRSTASSESRRAALLANYPRRETLNNPTPAPRPRTASRVYSRNTNTNSNASVGWNELARIEKERNAAIRARLGAKNESEYARQNEMQRIFNQARRRPPQNAGPGRGPGLGLGRANSARSSPKQIMNELRQKEVEEAAQWNELARIEKERRAIAQHVSRDQRNIKNFVESIPINQLPTATLPHAVTLQIAHVVTNHLANAHTPREQQAALRNAQALTNHPNMGKFMVLALDYAALATAKFIQQRRVVPNFMNERHAMLRNPRAELLATIFLIALIILPRLYYFVKQRQRNLTRQRR